MQGCCDAADVCELVGIFILRKLSNTIDKYSICLCCDDGRGVFEKLSGPQIEQRKKKNINIFKDCRLLTTVTSNITNEVFLSLTSNLKSDSYQPFRKLSQIILILIQIVHLK